MARKDDSLIESVVDIKRVAQQTKGGTRIGFTALMVVGDGKGKVGVGLGKAKDVRSAIHKGVRLAKDKMIQVPLENGTIPYPFRYKKGAVLILLKPGKEGTALVAGGVIREMANAAGIDNLVGKMLGSRNKIANAWAVWDALREIKKIYDQKKNV